MQNNKINYLELKAPNLPVIKEFYQKTFSWEFVDYGPTYTSFTAASSGIDGGFEQTVEPIVNGALVVLYHSEIAKAETKVIVAGGKISKAIFTFPGGRRFHFIDPAGNELAVWLDK